MDDPAPTSTISHKLFILVAIVLAVAVAWTGGWFWIRSEVASRMDVQVGKLSDKGLSISCPERTIGGWPFRIDIDCSDPTFSQPSKLTTISVKHLRLTALIYQPARVIIELDGPLAATGPDGESINAVWTDLQASIGLVISSQVRPSRIAIVANGLIAGVAKPGGQEVKLQSAHAEIHARPAPDAVADSVDFDVAVNLTAAALSVADRILGPEGADWSIDSTIRNAPVSAASGGGVRSMLKAWSADGGKLDIKNARMSQAGFTLDGQGVLSAGDDGLVDGQIKFVAAGFAALMARRL